MISYRTTARQLAIVNKARPLVFGHYAWTQETKKVDEAGSGILVAPRLALSAKHVSKSIEKLDSRIEAVARRRTPFDSQYRVIKMRTKYSAQLYQVPRDDEIVGWGVDVDWASPDTDITAMLVKPVTPAAELSEHELRYLEWQLLPPRVGAAVLVFGWPEPDIVVEADGHHMQEVGLHVEFARVDEHVYPMQAHGFGEFPAFRLNRDLPHGFSGGSVLYGDRLTGIFSGPDLVACLWPLALHLYPDIDGIDCSFADHFDSGHIVARDWGEVRGRVNRQPCEEALADSSVDARCSRKHVVLRARPWKVP